MKTANQIKAITLEGILARQAENKRFYDNYIENTIEPEILSRANNGYRYCKVDFSAVVIDINGIDYIASEYTKAGYDVIREDNVTIRICWDCE